MTDRGQIAACDGYAFKLTLLVTTAVVLIIVAGQAVISAL